MGWFSKKCSSSEGQGREAPDEPFVADDQTVAHVAELMRRFKAATGNSDSNMTYAVARGISSEAGLRDFPQVLSTGLALMNRPWRMLASTAARAAQNRDHALVADIFGFTWFWQKVALPQLGAMDIAEVLLGACPAPIEAEIATVALGSLLQLPEDQIVFKVGSDAVTVGMLAGAAANMVVHAASQGVPVDAATAIMANTVLGQG